MKNSNIKFIVFVDDEYNEKMSQIAKNMRAIGCTINKILKISGIIIGSAPKEVSFDEIKRKVRGIKSIEKDRNISI